VCRELLFRPIGETKELRLAKVVVVIPGRYGSTRLRGSAGLLAGASMIQRVYERAKLASGPTA